MKPLTIKENAVSPAVLRERLRALDGLEETSRSQIQWDQCKSPDEYRQMRLQGTNGFPKPVINPDARTLTIGARDGHQIELRLISPKASPNGVFLHFHAGGFVIGSSKSYDPYLGALANSLSMTVVSVEYRLAPENPYPAGPLDCLDAALFALSPEGSSQLGGRLRVMGGESAGGYCAVWVALALRDEHNIDVRSSIDALVPGCGIFDITYTPSLLSNQRDIVVSKNGMVAFVEAAFSHVPFAERKSPEFSPLYADLSGMPPALFLVGGADLLVDDSVFMAAKWSAAGNDAELRIIPGACHAFTLFPLGDVTEEGRSEVVNFILRNIP